MTRLTPTPHFYFIFFLQKAPLWANKMRVKIFSSIGLKMWAVATDKEKVTDRKKIKLGILVPPAIPRNGHGSHLYRVDSGGRLNKKAIVNNVVSRRFTHFHAAIYMTSLWVNEPCNSCYFMCNKLRFDVDYCWHKL